MQVGDTIGTRRCDENSNRTNKQAQKLGTYLNVSPVREAQSKKRLFGRYPEDEHHADHHNNKSDNNAFVTRHSNPYLSDGEALPLMVQQREEPPPQAFQRVSPDQ